MKTFIISTIAVIGVVMAGSAALVRHNRVDVRHVSTSFGYDPYWTVKNGDTTYYRTLGQIADFSNKWVKE